MSTTTKPAGHASVKTMVETVALRDVSTGRHWSLLGSGLVTAGRHPEDCDLILRDPEVSRVHLEIFRTKGNARIRCVGKNKPKHLGATIVEGEIPAGDWIEISADLKLQFITAAMLAEEPAAAFFLGVGNHRDISMSFHAGARRLPLVLVGKKGTGRELLARSIHRMASRPREAFLVVDERVRGVNLVAFLALHKEITAYVDLSMVKKLDMHAIRELAKVPGAPIQWIFVAPSMEWTEETIPVQRTRESNGKLCYELPELAKRSEDRMHLAALVLQAHGRKNGLDRFPEEQLRQVLHHARTGTREDVWIATLRLLALAQSGGETKAASVLLRSWGYEKNQARATLDSWILNLDIDLRAWADKTNPDGVP